MRGERFLLQHREVDELGLLPVQRVALAVPPVEELAAVLLELVEVGAGPILPQPQRQRQREQTRMRKQAQAQAQEHKRTPASASASATA